jgi:HEAT repeat protein
MPDSVPAFTPAFFAALVLAAAIAAPLYLFDVVRRRERRAGRERLLRLRALLRGFGRGAVKASALRRAVRDHETEVFWDAIEVLPIGLPRRLLLGEALDRTKPALLERRALREEPVERRVIAAERLGRLLSRASRRALRRALERGPEPVAAAAALSLARGRDAWTLRHLLDHPELLAHRTARFRATVLRAFGRGALPVLHQALVASGDPSLQRAIIDTLGSARHRESAALIARRLGDVEPEVRVAAARALGLLEVESFALLLRDALEDPHWAVRAQSARALGRLRATGFEEALARRLSDPAWWVRRHAAYALAELGESGREALQRAAESSPDRYAREMAAEVLQGGWLRRTA